MTQTISRTYAVRENADAAAAELKNVGFPDRAITLIGPEAPEEQRLASMRLGGVVASHAPVYAEALQHGETLVSVLAPFGYALMATTILEKHGPTHTGLGEQGYEKRAPDPDAPFSSACGWTVLIDNPAPLSSSLGWKVLSTNQRPRIADEDLVDNPAPFSKTIDTPVLTDRPTILSSRLGWKVLSENPAPLSSRFRWPILSKAQSPGHSRFGLPLLLHDAAPLSSRIGWKLLSNDPAPLSRLFGLRVLSGERSK